VNAPIEGFTFSSEVNTEEVKRAWMNVRIEHLLKTKERQIKEFTKNMDAPEGVFTNFKKQFKRRGVPISHSILNGETLDPLKSHPLVNKVQHLYWNF